MPQLGELNHDAPKAVRRRTSYDTDQKSPVTIASILLLAISTLAASGADQGVWDQCNQTRDTDASISACTQILQAPGEIASDRAIAYYSRGGAFSNKGDRDRAIADYTMAIKANPQYADAYAGRGIVYQAKGDRDRALADYTKAIEINPRYAEAYVGRGIIYRARGDSDRAIADYSQAIEINPQLVNAYFNRGSALAAKATTTWRSPTTAR